MTKSGVKDAFGGRKYYEKEYSPDIGVDCGAANTAAQVMQ
jgi:hypothetical protein